MSVADAISWKPTGSDVNLLLFRLCSPALRRIKVKNACNKRTKACSTPPRPLIHTDTARPLGYTIPIPLPSWLFALLKQTEGKKHTDWQALRRHLWCPLAKQQPKSWISVNSCKCMWVYDWECVCGVCDPRAEKNKQCDNKRFGQMPLKLHKSVLEQHIAKVFAEQWTLVKRNCVEAKSSQWDLHNLLTMLGF